MSGFSARMKKYLLQRITCSELVFQCYLFLLVRLVELFFVIFTFFLELVLISHNAFHFALFSSQTEIIYY